MSNTVNEFDAAKTISDLLKDIDKDRQTRILRWVAESLDISLHVRTTSQHGADGGAIENAIATRSTSPQSHIGKAADIKSFVESKNPKTDIQFAAVVAYYHRFEAPADDRKDTISAEVLQNATRLAGRARFSKPLATLNNAKKQGYLDAADRGSFRINSVGENLVAMTLPGETNSMKQKLTLRKKPKKLEVKPRARKA
jgi:hypothetical protein